MSRRPRRPTLHDFRIGELVTLSEPVQPLDAGDVVQVIGFRGEKQLRVLPIGGIPMLASFELVVRVEGLPAGSEKPPHRKRFQRKRRPARASGQAAASGSASSIEGPKREVAVAAAAC